MSIYIAKFNFILNAIIFPFYIFIHTNISLKFYYLATFIKTIIISLTAHKYCILVIREGGIEKLNTLISDPRPYERIKELAHIVIENCSRYSSNSNDMNVHSPLDEDYIYSSDG